MGGGGGVYGTFDITRGKKYQENVKKEERGLLLYTNNSYVISAKKLLEE